MAVKPIKKELRSNIKRGVAFLDEHYEGSWRDNVDIEALDMRFAHQCLLSQVYRMLFADATKEIGYSYFKDDNVPWLCRHGFYLASDLYAYDLLTELWKEELTQS